MKKRTEDFRNIHLYEENGKKIFCYRTGLTVYEEAFYRGCYMSSGWNTAGFMLNVMEDIPTRINNGQFTEAQSFDVEVDGVSLSWDWEYIGFTEEEEILEGGCIATHGRVELKSTVKPITAIVHTLLDGGDVFERWVEVINTGDAPANLNVASPMCGAIESFPRYGDYMNGAPDESKIYSLGYMQVAGHRHEGSFVWNDLPYGTHGFDGKYQFDRYRHPIFMLRNNLMGRIMIAQLGWSGGYSFHFNLNTDIRDAQMPEAHLSFRTDIKGQSPITILAPGETFVMPKMHIGMLAGDLDDAVNAMHKHLRRTVFNRPAPRGKKGWIVGGMGPERVMDDKAARHFIDTIAAVGGETMTIDAGWYCPNGTERWEWSTRVGDWHPAEGKYPGGLESIREYAHSKGLLFGLWIEIERAWETTPIAKEHPDWFVENYKRADKVSLLDLTKPEVAAWMESELERLIVEYKIDLLRLDSNTGTHGFQYRSKGKYGTECALYRHHKNLSEIFERLSRKYPDVVFENCAGGGGRTDVAFISNFTHTWVTDHNVPPRSFAVTNGMTMALPPELVDRLLSGMWSHTAASISWIARNAIFGRPTTNDYNMVGSKMNPAQIEVVKHTFDIYKTHIRPYVDDSCIYHHTPEVVSDATNGAYAEQPRGIGILERSSGDGKHGVIGVFALADVREQTAETVYPRGIDASLNYNVTFDNSGATVKMSGAELMNFGIRTVLHTSLTSELVIYEAID